MTKNYDSLGWDRDIRLKNGIGKDVSLSLAHSKYITSCLMGLMLLLFMSVNNRVYAQISMPYTETFGSIASAGGFPVVTGGNWTRSGTTSTQPTYIANQTDYNRSGNGDTKYIAFRWDSGTRSYFVGPFTLTSGTSYTASALYKADGLTGFGPLELRYGTTAAEATQTNVIVSVPSNIQNSAFQKIEGAFTADASGDYFISIRSTQNGNPWYLTIDDFKFGVTPTCIEASGLEVTDITATSANFAWTASDSAPASGYEWEIRTSGAAGSGTTGLEDSGTTITSVANSSSALLAAGTGYTLYLRANCGGGDFSAWISKAFTSAIILTTPWTEGFTTAAMPTGWTNTNYSNVGSIRGVTGNPGNNIYKNLYDNTDATEGGSFATVNYGPILAGQALSFDFKVANYDAPYAYPGDGWGSFEVEVSTDFGASWESLGTVNTAVAGWNMQSYPLTDYLGLTLKVKITAAWTAGDYDLAFDNFAIQVPPTCLPPTAVATAELGSSSVTVSWTESESTPSNGYAYEVRTSGAAGSGATGLAASGTTPAGDVDVDLTDLASSTPHFFYVRSDCGSGDFSSWASVNFTTLLGNDSCADAIVVACGSSTPASVVGATQDNMAVCGISGVTTQSTPGVWYKIAGTGETMTASTASSLTNIDTRIGVYSGECGTMTCIGGNDDKVPTIDFRSEVMFPTTIGTDYYVLVYLYSAFTTPEPIILTVTCVPACTPATGNDDCDTAEAVTVGTPLATNNTCAATSITEASPTCGNQFGSYFDTWYTFDSGTNTVLEVSTIATAPTVVGYAVYSGACGSLTSIACSLTGAAGNVTLTANTVYYVRAFSTSPEARGEFTLTLKAPCLVPTALLVEDIMTTGATFNWTESLSSPGNGYEFEVRTSGAAGSGATGLVDSGTVAAGIVTASSTILLPETAYTVYVRSSCGASDYSPWVSKAFTTNPLCMVPTALMVTDITETSATISWTAPTTAPGVGYEFYVSEVNTAPTGAGTGTTTDVSEVLELSASTTYFVWVRSVCADGVESAWKAFNSFSTLCDDSAVPYVLNIDAVTVPAIPGCLVVENVNNDNKTWVTADPSGATTGITGKAMMYPWHGSNAADDWFFLRGIQLTAGTNYELKFKYKDWGFEEKLRVSIGDSPVSTSMTEELFDVTTTEDETAHAETIEFSVDADGVYYIGFQAHSDADMFNLYVGEISVDVSLSTPGFERSKLSYYPNPVKDVLTLNYADTIDSVQVYNLLGQKVFESKYATSEVKIDMNKFAAGTYVVNVVSKDMTKNIKVVKK